MTFDDLADNASKVGDDPSSGTSPTVSSSAPTSSVATTKDIEIETGGDTHDAAPATPTSTADAATTAPTTEPTATTTPTTTPTLPIPSVTVTVPDLPSTVPTSTATATATATATSAPICDEDGDGVLKGGSACAPPTGTQADCDDTEKRVHPGADFVPDSWPASSPHVPANDWNCDGAVTKQMPYAITCASLSDCTEGFALDVACGATGTYNVCKKVGGLLGGLLCAVDHTEIRTQACR